MSFEKDWTVKAVLNQPDTNKLNGARDKALLTFLYNTGSRVQEAFDLEISDINMENPKQSGSHRKGGKTAEHSPLLGNRRGHKGIPRFPQKGRFRE